MSDSSISLALSIKDGQFRLPNGITVNIPVLQVPDKGLLVVVGPNGGGKTSLATYLCGLRREQPNIGQPFPSMCWQHPELVPGAVLDNLEFVRRSSKFALGAKGDIEAALRFVDLAATKWNGAGELSGGEAQRLNIARTLLTSRFGMVLDEPSTSLDYLGVEQLVTAIEVYLGHRDPVETTRWISELEVERRYVICITHDRMLMERFAPFAPRVVSIDLNTARDGEPITVDTNEGRGYSLEEARSHPPSLFWAEFFDTRNIFFVEGKRRIDSVLQLRRHKAGTNGFVIVPDTGVLVRRNEENSRFVQGQVREIYKGSSKASVLVGFRNKDREPVSIWARIEASEDAWLELDGKVWIALDKPIKVRSQLAEEHQS